jgi:cytochrome c
VVFIGWLTILKVNMNGLEFNKIAAGVLIAGLVAMISGKIADSLYHPEPAQKRGFEVAALEDAGAGGGASAPTEPVKLGALLAKANPENGKVIAKKCMSCHSFEQGGPNLVGPNLYGVLGRSCGAKPNFDYSSAMQAHGGSWDYEGLYHFIHSPKAAVPGTKMTFPGLKKPEELADVIAFLRTLGSSGTPLPPESLEINP